MFFTLCQGTSGKLKCWAWKPKTLSMCWICPILVCGKDRTQKSLLYAKLWIFQNIKFLQIFQSHFSKGPIVKFTHFFLHAILKWSYLSFYSSELNSVFSRGKLRMQTRHLSSFRVFHDFNVFHILLLKCVKHWWFRLQVAKINMEGLKKSKKSRQTVQNCSDS
jgi:hypothetical protein